MLYNFFFILHKYFENVILITFIVKAIPAGNGEESVPVIAGPSATVYAGKERNFSEFGTTHLLM